MGPESCDMMKNRDENIEQRETKFDSTDENSDRLSDKTTDSVKEHSEALSRNGRIPDDMIEHSSSSQRTDISGQFNRNFAAVIVGSDHKFTVRSRYRHASAGSCHDLCKFGHNHERVKAEKRPLTGTIRDREPFIRPASVDTLAKSVPGKETENKSQFTRLFHSGPLPRKGVLTHTDGTHSPKRITSPQAKMKQVQSERQPSSVSTPGNSFCRSKTEVSAVKKIWPVKSSQKVEEIKREEKYRPGESKKVKAKELMSSNSPRTPLEESPSIKATLYKNFKSFSRSRCQSNSEGAIINKSCVVPEIAVESNAKNPEKGIKSSPPDDESPSAQNDSRLSKTKKSRIIEEGEHKRNTYGAKTIVNQHLKAKRAGISRLKEKDDSAWKVNFRKGSVVDLQAANDSSRKLRFKKGRIFGEDQNAKAEISLKNTDELTLPDIGPEPEKVHLRRQESSGKKHSIDLNNVIRETASKLVKTRKSKVKALIGAFETVMSFGHREVVNLSLKLVLTNTE